MTRTITRAVVAAGGAGTKMAPITRIIPKEMLPVARTPILEHLVHELRAAGITDVLFVISSRKGQIPAYFGSGTAYGMDFSYRVQDDGAGPGAPVLAAERWTQGQPFVLAFGDNLIHAGADGEAPLRRLVHGGTADCSVLTRVFPADSVPPHETLLGAASAPRAARSLMSPEVHGGGAAARCPAACATARAVRRDGGRASISVIGLPPLHRRVPGRRGRRPPCRGS
jgi:hypothetical protein